MKIPELLAPVGSKDALKAAVQNGADAIYLGGKMFSARQYADNFDRDDLREAFEYAHVRGVKVYVTANTLLHDREFFDAVDYLKFLYEAGADAIIVQDMGVLSVAEKLFPELPLHASTQMTIHNSPGVEVLKNHNFTRIVPARELSLREIAEIKKKTGLEIEVFVHGALCVSYSGQCLMSSMIGGRSGNRGRCAQPCRMEYALVDKNGRALVSPAEVGSHLLSPMDLNMIKHIPELVEAGVDSLKIEGRMKRPEYVATVTRIYRDALDRFKSSPESYSVDEKSLKNLTQIFNRGFTTGYFFGKQGGDMMSFKRPNNRGLRLGRVTNTNRAERMVEVMLEDTLRRGDGIEFWVTEGGRRGIIANRIIRDGRPVELALAGEKVWIDAEGKIRPGDRIFKTHDVELISRAEVSYTSPKEIKKIPLYFEINARLNSPFSISVTDSEKNSFTAVSEFLGQEALKKPLTLESLHEQTDRLGNTPYSIGQMEAVIDEGVMIPASVINETRRNALEGLSELRAKVKRPHYAGEGKYNELVTQVLKSADFESSKARRSPENMKISAR
ncbi:MAG TPA: U32 family peptidase, partial [Desulfobacteria bacterium]|nr:U32 family peptidase [Desulfobacteria bacterium]